MPVSGSISVVSTAEPSRHPAAHLRAVPALASVTPLPVECRSWTGGSVATVRCPSCADVDDKVVDSRMADDGSSIRRRRECLACGYRFTTFERYEEQPIVVVKRSGDRVPFERAKVEAGIVAAAKGRPITLEQIAFVAEALEDQFRLQGEVTSEHIGLAVLDQLRELDEVAYVRFASVYKDFDDAADFQREIGLLTKETAPKRH
jgi:transcriptional repressor NrdR